MVFCVMFRCAEYAGRFLLQQIRELCAEAGAFSSESDLGGDAWGRV